LASFGTTRGLTGLHSPRSYQFCNQNKQKDSSEGGGASRRLPHTKRLDCRSGARQAEGFGAAARHPISAAVQGRAAAEGFSPELPRAHWTGPELGC